jgi:hypothetical protein
MLLFKIPLVNIQAWFKIQKETVMSERYKLPKDGYKADFFAEFVLKEEGNFFIATDGWIQAPHRGDEIMQVVHNELQRIASETGRKVVHRYEADSLAGKKLIQRQSGYNWKGRSPTGNSVYEREFTP